ncbi:protein moonraker-like isoform X2 [Acanthaster planci]|uniref:Protein moonraker-like isoform X2 n=1 Tax=Acanthaster planci TaxID=133434 RepID=A0A8B7YJB7_ACAPL|nr:protein moonraker-like isoform X2 [Acanthaster planci]
MLQQNQLQFNLEVPSLPSNLATRYRNPGPLVIERLAGGTLTSDSGPGEPKEPPVKFTTISEDQLSVALRLARLDLKNIASKSQAPATKYLPQHDHQRPGKKHKSKQSPSGKNHHQLRTTKLKERFTDPNESQRSIETQTHRSKTKNTKDAIVLQPVSTHRLFLSTKQHQHGDTKREELSPPTGEVALSPKSRQVQEIRRLRSELKTYMKKVEELSIKASRPSQEMAKKDAEVVEDDPRRAARAAEQASRSARLLYSLQQQVREIQEELDKLGPGKVRHTKKSRALNRLAAAHRGAVRALQSFLHHLPSEVDPGNGLPPHYQELALLIRQLSLCCAQLDVEESGIPEGVLNILEQAKDFQDALSGQISTPPRPKANHDPQPRANSRRRLAFEGDAPRGPPNRAATSTSRSGSQGQASPKALNPHHYRIRETPVRDTDRDPLHATTQVTPGPATVERLGKSVVSSKVTPGSPERNAALRAGLEALLRAGGQPAGPLHPATSNPVPRGQLPTAKARKQPPARGSTAPSRSLILPAALKAARERLHRVRVVPRDAHFTQETVASKLKHREPVGQGIATSRDPGTRPQDGGPVMRAKPTWTPPGSPRSFHKALPRPRPVSASSEDEKESEEGRDNSARRRKVVFNLEKESGSRKDVGSDRERGLDPDMMEREIARQAWLDREAAKQMKHLEHGREENGYPPVPPGWLETVEQALTARLRPLIDKAEATAKEQQHVQNSTKQSLRHQLSERAVQATSNNADLLSDLLLEDILADTALEFHRIERDDQLERQAQQLQDGPTVEGMLQSLEKMELMEDEIRRRWRRVEYINQEELLTDSIHQKEVGWMLGTPLDGEFLESFPGDVPTAHTAMQFTNQHSQDAPGSQPSISKAKSSRGTKIPLQTDEVTYLLYSRDDHDVGIRSLAENDVQVTEMDSKQEKGFLSREDTDRSVSRVSGATPGQTHSMNILHTLLDNKGSAAARPGSLSNSRKSGTRPGLDRPSFPLFIPSDAMNRIRDYRGRFEHHLKNTSHWAYGTFDPWRLVEEVSDEIVSEIIKDVSSEVGDIMSQCVDDLYRAEFDMT